MVDRPPELATETWSVGVHELTRSGNERATRRRLREQCPELPRVDFPISPAGCSVNKPIFTARRESGHRRPRGYADWRPHAKTRALLEQIDAVLAEYAAYLPMSVRQVYYRLVGAFEYEKTERAYERLAECLVRARRARLIPFDHIRDDGVTIYPVSWYSDIEGFHTETARRAREYRRDRQEGQYATIELWTEAAGMAPQLAKVAHRYSIPVYSSGGFSSLTAVRDIVNRAIRWQGTTVVLHVGDYDPSGVAIFDAIAADAAAFVEADRHIQTTAIVPQRVALTRAQVVEHDLPTAPAKTSDRRSRSWRGETCQLEALAPDVLAQIVEAAIIEHFDAAVLREVLNQEKTDRAELLGLPRGGT
jgi:hypothetical protein